MCTLELLLTFVDSRAHEIYSTVQVAPSMDKFMLKTEVLEENFSRLRDPS